jgi:2-polyprenyl-6-methoxyphenol hydroxylase-like FAD-dependent oxidoreductase
MAGRHPAERHAAQLGAHLYQWLRRGVPDELYRGASTVELIDAGPHGTTLHLGPGGAVDFDLVVCADGYRSIGRRLIDPDATLGATRAKNI